jgi:uncharacterized membrane protein
MIQETSVPSRRSVSTNAAIHRLVGIGFSLGFTSFVSSGWLAEAAGKNSNTRFGTSAFKCLGSASEFSRLVSLESFLSPPSDEYGGSSLSTSTSRIGV